MDGHPMRHALLHVFKRDDDTGGGSAFVAMFYPYKTYPMFFRAPSRREVVEAAEQFRAEAIEKHEATVIARQEAARKAKEARERKARQVEDS